MKKVIALFAFAIAVYFVASIGAQAAPNTNSHKEATGTFLYTVEPPLVINTLTGQQDLGAVCPGCTVNFENPKCLVWQVQGGASCTVAVMMQLTTPPASGVTITTAKEYSDEYPSGGWEPWATGGDGHVTGTGNSAVGLFKIGAHDLRFRVCASSLAADNTAAATTSGSSVWTIIADYTSAIAPHN